MHPILRNRRKHSRGGRMTPVHLQKVVCMLLIQMFTPSKILPCLKLPSHVQKRSLYDVSLLEVNIHARCVCNRVIRGDLATSCACLSAVPNECRLLQMNKLHLVRLRMTLKSTRCVSSTLMYRRVCHANLHIPARMRCHKIVLIADKSWHTILTRDKTGCRFPCNHHTYLSGPVQQAAGCHRHPAVECQSAQLQHLAAAMRGRWFG